MQRRGSHPAIVVERLNKSYGDTHAVRDVSFEVAAGESVAVLGPNGAGKTTVIEILEGFRKLTSGRVEVLGCDPMIGGSTLRERIGIVLQTCAVDPYLSVREVIQMHAGYYPHPRGTDEVIELVGLAERSGSRVNKLSGGQQRRLDVALGLVGDPELLFLDEPTTGFDPEARRQSWQLVEDLRSLGKTVLLTTHYMDEAQHLADRLIVLARGEIVAEGSPESIGGRSSAPAEIGFRIPAGCSMADLPVIVDDVVAGVAQIRTLEATAVLACLATWAVDRGEELAGLTVSRPTLEDVYLELIRQSDSTRVDEVVG
ncbi:MAG: ABC transporter ATP-binding protein [Acidimicrobiales bacterium]